MPRKGWPVAVPTAGACALVAGLMVGLGTAAEPSSDPPSTANSRPAPGDVLARGVGPSGLPYTISAYEEDDQLCVVVESGGFAGGGCSSGLSELDVGQVLLGTDQFVWGLTKRDANGMVVRRLDGRGEAVTSRPAVIGDRNLLHVAMDAPQSTLPRTEFGLPVSPGVEVLAMNAGHVRGSATMRPALSGSAAVHSGGMPGRAADAGDCVRRPRLVRCQP
jgi:hypothetical protein